MHCRHNFNETKRSRKEVGVVNETFQQDLLEVNSSNKLGAFGAKDYKRTNIHYAMVAELISSFSFLLVKALQRFHFWTCILLKFFTFVRFKSAGRNLCRNQSTNPFVTVVPVWPCLSLTDSWFEDLVMLPQMLLMIKMMWRTLLGESWQ